MENNTPSSESPAPQEPHHDRQVLRILRNVDLNLLTIFEAVYVHKGIVNAAKVLNITPSAISQSLNKLRAVFPDPLFIRKGQGVRPTAYATHLHQYISQGMESFLSALDLACGAAQPRALTIATSPLIGALVIPTIAHALKPRGERRCGFSSDNLFAQAALISQSDMLGLMPERMFSLLAQTWSLARLDYAQLPEERIEIALHYNRQSAQEPLLNQVIEVVCQSFKQ